jgi:hypothetical protein
LLRAQPVEDGLVGFAELAVFKHTEVNVFGIFLT